MNRGEKLIVWITEISLASLNYDSTQEFESEDMMHRGRKNRRNVYDNREASRIQQRL